MSSPLMTSYTSIEISNQERNAVTNRHKASPTSDVGRNIETDDNNECDRPRNATNTNVDVTTTPRQHLKHDMASPPPTKFRQFLSTSSAASYSTPTSKFISKSNTTTTSTIRKNIDHILLQQGLVRHMISNTPTLATSASPPTTAAISMKYYTPQKKINTPNRISSTIMPVSASSSSSRHPQEHQQRYKTIYFIRHGESLGQIATTHDRRHNEKLKDCGLSALGIRQSQHQLRHFFHKVPKIELILCSPLTRAIQTAILAFGTDIEAADTTNVYNILHPDNVEGCIPTDIDTTESALTTNVTQPKILIHYHLREMGSNIPENQPRTMKQVCDYLINVGTVRNKREWDTLIDTVTLQPPPPVSSSMYYRYSHLVSPSPIKMKQPYSSNLNKNGTGSQCTVHGEHEHSETIHGSWPYSNRNNTADTVPNVLRRDYIQYMLQWIALHRSETNIAIVCHYHVIRAALSSSSPLSNQCNNKTSKSDGSSKKENNTTTPRKKVVDIRPENAQPIKCYLCTWTGQIRLASEMDNVHDD